MTSGSFGVICAEDQSAAESRLEFNTQLWQFLAMQETAHPIGHDLQGNAEGPPDRDDRTGLREFLWGVLEWG
jgi:hypothetical protein